MYGEPHPVRRPVLALCDVYTQNDQTDVNRQRHHSDYDHHNQGNYVFIAHVVSFLWGRGNT
jgi:hypothetical protein